MLTSNFAISGRKPEAVAISRGIPNWFRGRRYLELAPTSKMLEEAKTNTDSFYDQYRKEILGKVKAKTVLSYLGDNAVLLCWEPFNVYCHRRIVAEWLEKELGIVVPEFGHERSESLSCRAPGGSRTAVRASRNEK